MEDTDKGGLRVESTDEFVARCCGYMVLLAALVQTDEPGSRYGLAYGWAFLARFLNTLPANR